MAGPTENASINNAAAEGSWRAGLALINQGTPLLRKDVLVASFFINILLLAFPLVVLQVYDRILPNQAMGTLLLLVLGVAVALVLDAVLKTARAFIAGWAGAHFEHHVGLKSLEYLMSASADKFEVDPAGKHLDRLAGVDLVRDFYSSQASLVLVDLPFVIVFIAVLGYISGSLALVPVGLLVIFGFISLRIGVRLRRALAARTEWDDRRFSFIIEVLNGIHTVKSAAMEKLIERRYERLMQNVSDAGMQVAYLSGLAQNVGASFAQITMVAVVGIGSIYVVNGAISMGALAACMLLSGRTVQPMLRALGVWARFQAIRIAEVNLDELRQYKEEQTLIKPLAADLDTIRLRNVYFRYNEQSPFILRGINLEARPGEIIGIRGGNGSGKSTLMRMLMAAMTPTRGAVFYNDHNSKRTDLSHFRSQVGYLPQRPALLEGTVLENITMFRGEEYYDEALEIAERLGLDKVFARYPDGYDTVIGTSTHSSVPDGVAQRITIARALVGSPRFILFDEANSALDGPGDARIRGVLQYYKPRSAIVLVSYRPSLLSVADRRYELVQGALLPWSEPPTPETPAEDAAKESSEAPESEAPEGGRDE